MPIKDDWDERKPLLENKTARENGAFSKPALLIYLTVFGSRYSYYAIQTILPLFLRNKLLYSENTSTIIYQTYDGLSNILPTFLAVFGDSILGKYRANIHFSVIYILGNLVLTVSAMSLLGIVDARVLASLTLITVAIGYGGIVPVQNAFGGDQFELPKQQAQVTTFFATFYFTINVGSTLANIFTPIMRKNVHCLGGQTCYSLGFGVAAVAAIFGLVVFILGKNFYRIRCISESVIARTLKCIAYAIGNRNSEKSEHWLDSARDKYGQLFVNDVKALLRLIILFTPLIFFWALWNQQASTWTFQASRMTGYITEGFSLEPDQLQVTNSIILLALIPLFEIAVYPLLGKLGLLKKPLQRIRFGCACMALSFVIAGGLELILQKSYPVLPDTGETSFNVINTLACPVSLQIDPIFIENTQPTNESIRSYGQVILPLENAFFSNIAAVDYNITASAVSCPNSSIEFPSQPGTIRTFVIAPESPFNTTARIFESETTENLKKSNEGNAIFRVIAGNIPKNLQSLDVTLASYFETTTVHLAPNDPETISTEIEPDRYTVSLSFQGVDISNETLSSVNLESGGSYLLGIFRLENGTFVLRNYVLTEPNSIHMLYQIPQYFALTIGELLVAITGFQFAYEQAPASMKSLLQSIWMLPMGMGDVVVVVITAFNLFPTQAMTFFFFAGLMFVATAWFAVVAHHFKPRSLEPERLSSLPPSPFRERERKRSIVESFSAHVQ